MRLAGLDEKAELFWVARKAGWMPSEDVCPMLTCRLGEGWQDEARAFLSEL